MNISIFDVLGPIMIGPSSSHTAGAARLGKMAALLAGKPFSRVAFGLSGSFAKTGKGHGTHKALLAGVLGLGVDDERIPQSNQIAEERGIEVEYFEENLDNLHENAVHIIFTHGDGEVSNIYGASIGGGRVVILKIGDLTTEITGEAPTIVVSHIDRPGVVSGVSQILADNNINIAVMRLSRQQKGKKASLVAETDGAVPLSVVEKIQALPNVVGVSQIDLS